MSDIRKISLDFETRSRVDIKKCGAYKYAECPDAKVLILAVKQGGWGDPHPYLSWDLRQPVEGNPAIKLLRRAIEEGWEVHAYNSQFEWAILKHVCPRQFGFPVPDINNMRCSSALCRSAGMPPRLAQVAEFLKLPVQKDKIGLPLIQKFSVPQKKTGKFIEWSDDITFTLAGEKVTAAEAFQKFVDYCVRDVEVECHVAEIMKPFTLKGHVLDTFLFDARMNDRGVPVDRVALENAFLLYKEHEVNLGREFREITGLDPGQNKKLLEWFRERGYKGTSLDKATREAWAGDEGMDPLARKAMEIKAELSYAAVKKIPAMLNMVMSDGFIRGAFLWCGAQKTWRWTSLKVQFTNMKKPGKKLRKFIEEAFQDIRNGIDLETLMLFYGNPYEVIACLARYFVRFPDCDIYDLDYSSVEAKILPMLIGCRRILDRFESGEDIYTTTAKALSLALGETIDRDMGKTIVLATQFQGGWNAVFTATGSKWPRDKCEKALAIVRKENPEFPRAWSEFQDAFVAAMDKPGTWVKAGDYCSFGYTNAAPFPRMLLRFASGRKVVMPMPRKSPITMAKIETLNKAGNVIKTKWERCPGRLDKDGIERYLDIGDSFLNPNTKVASSFFTWELSFYGHTENGHYGRVNTYGGDCLQTFTQGTGLDLLAHGALQAEKAGFEPFILVHDQGLCPAKGDKEEMVRAFCDVPKWFAGFPLSAEADTVRSYCKN